MAVVVVDGDDCGTVVLRRRRIRFRLVVAGRASCGIVLLVKEASILLLAPLMRLITCSLKGQDSQP